MTDEKGRLGRRFPAIPTQPSDDLLHSGIAILPGSHDTLGLPLIVFPVKSHTQLLGTKVSEICLLIKYYISITRPGQRLNGFAFLIDLKVANVQLFNIVVETLETLQRENQGCVAVFYCLQPRGKEACKFLKKLLGLKDKKRRLRLPFKKSTYKLESQRGRNNCIFKSVLMTDLTELYRYIEGRQVTTEFGGTLLFHIESWILFRQDLEGLYQDIDRVLESVPSTQDKIEMLKEYDLPETNEELEQLLGWIRNRYHDVMKELNIEAVIDECKNMVTKCKNPDSYAIYSDLQNNFMLQDAIITLEKHHVRLVTSRNQLQVSWQEAEKRLKKASNVRSYKEKTEKIIKWLNEVGMPKFKEPVEIADSLSQAETLKNHFEAGFYTTAKETLYEAEELIENMEKMALDTSREIQETVEYSRNFQSKISEFRLLLERRLRKYLDIYHFYLLSGKVTRWYRRTLTFLPIKYLSHYIDYDHDDLVPLCQEWNAEVNKYLYKHPAPRLEHLNKIREGVPLVSNMRNRNQARLLVHRVGLLRNLLVEGKIKVIDYIDLLKLKEKVLRGYDDLDNDLSRSMPDLTRIQRAESAYRHHNMSATLSRLPPSHQAGSMTDMEPPVSRARSVSSLYAPRRGSDAVDFDRGEMESRLRPRLGLSATMDRYQKVHELYADPDSNLRRFRSQPLVNQPQTYPDLNRQTSRDRDSIGRKGLVPKHSSKHTPGRRFVKARDQRSSRNHSQSNVGDDSEDTELSYPTNKRTFSFHRNPVDRNDYGIYGESDNCDDSVFSGQSSSSTLPLRDSRERYISLNFPSEPLSLPCSPPPHFLGGERASSSQSNYRGNQSLPSAFRTKEDSYDSGIGYTEPGIHAGARINPLYSSLPNLIAKDLRLPQTMQRDDSLSMTQENLNKISQSNLLPAEKLELMSAMLDNEDPGRRSPRRPGAVDPVKVPNAHVTNNLRLTTEEQNLVREILDKQKGEKKKQEGYYREEMNRRTGNSPNNLERTPKIYFNRPGDEEEDNEGSGTSDEEESEDDSNAGASTDEDVKRLNEAIQARRQEQLRLARNRQKLHQIDEQMTSPSKNEQKYRSPEKVIQDGTRQRSPHTMPRSPVSSHDDPLGYTLQRLQQTSPRQNRENGIYGTDSDYSGSEANSSMKPEEDYNRNRVMENGNASSVKEWVQRIPFEEVSI
ncbi:uncharacterized protein LOC135492315 isoform X2 [Lineus longissimus]|uniref:uncharacterized protein LOC135492315 isoform X2 n=1 Tax=Lineus longissimus TaxID=88925 RepID=UPI00315CA98D